MRVTATGQGVSVRGNENSLNLHLGDNCLTLKYTKTTELYIYFKWVNFMVPKLHVSKNITKEVTASEKVQRCFNLRLSNEATVTISMEYVTMKGLSHTLG